MPESPSLTANAPTRWIEIDPMAATGPRWTPTLAPAYAQTFRRETGWTEEVNLERRMGACVERPANSLVVLSREPIDAALQRLFADWAMVSGPQA